MATLRPFRALRPTPSRAAEVAAVPYDIVNREEAASLAAGHPLSFLHVSRPEIDLPPRIEPYAPEVYAKAASNFRALIRDCPLLTEADPMLYVYRLSKAGHQQTGIAATFSVDEYDHDLIKKHERTRKDKEDDRTRHILTLGAQTGPVFLAYRGQAEINQFIANITAKKPLYDFVAEDGVTHTLWSVMETETLVGLFKKVPALYIADGHHRAASASRARAELRSKNPDHRGDEDYNFMMAAAFPAEELRIFPYHRILKDWNGNTPDTLLERLDKDFIITPGASPDPDRGQFALFLKETGNGKWYGLRPKTTATDGEEIDRLDVSLLQNKVLTPIFGISDPRTDKRIDFVGGIRGTAELEKLVRSGSAVAAFSLFPTTLDDLISVSDAGQIMPPKSTWFEPKLRDGLVSHWISEPGKN